MSLNVTVTKTVNCFILHSLDTTEGERGDICQPPPPFPCIRQMHVKMWSFVTGWKADEGCGAPPLHPEIMFLYAVDKEYHHV